MERRFIEKKRTTLSEFFTVLGILSLFFALLILAVNPLQRYFESQDNKRKNDVKALTEAVYGCVDSLNGIFPEAIQNMDFDKYYIIGTQKNCRARCDFVDVEDVCFDLSQIQCGNSITLVPDYRASLPKDPDRNLWNDRISGYYITKTSSGEVKIDACNPSFTP